MTNLGMAAVKIGRIFAYLEVGYFGQFFNYKSSSSFWATFFQVMYLFLAKMGRATFCAILSQTQLVILAGSYFHGQVCHRFYYLTVSPAPSLKAK
jgi:hypothetical protein